MAPGSAFLREELRCSHVSHGPRRAVDHRKKERLSCPGMQLGSRIFQTRLCVTEAPADMQTATVRLYSAASAQLTTHGHGYSSDMTR
jgi:hypothetical protein